MTPEERLTEVTAARDSALQAERDVAKRLQRITHSPQRGLLRASRMLQAVQALEAARRILDQLVNDAVIDVATSSAVVHDRTHM
jgi:hypothetical protein